MHGSALAKYAGVITGGLRWRAIDISRDIVSYELSGWIMIEISPVSFLHTSMKMHIEDQIAR